MITKAVESKGRAVERKQEVEGRLCVLKLQRNANIWSIYTIQTIWRFKLQITQFRILIILLLEFTLLGSRDDIVHRYREVYKFI